jgi:hypothetical protein
LRRDLGGVVLAVGEGDALVVAAPKTTSVGMVMPASLSPAPNPVSIL